MQDMKFTTLPPAAAGAKRISDEILGRREALTREMEGESIRLASLRNRYTETKAELDEVERHVVRSGDVDAISRAAILRQTVQSLEVELLACNGSLLDLGKRSIAIDEEIGSAWPTLAAEDRSYAAKVIADLQSDLDEVSRQLVRVLSRAYSVSKARGYMLRDQLSKMVIADLVPRHEIQVPSRTEPLIVLGSAIDGHSAKIGGDDLILWKNVRADENLDGLTNTCRKMEFQIKRIEANRLELEAKDPALREQRARERRERISKEKEDLRRLQEEARERENAEREERAEKIRRGEIGAPRGEVREPGTRPAWVGRPADGMDPVRAAAAQAERIATGT